MIFVTVGTHEQPFNRLVECIDKLREDGSIKEQVIIQTGYSTYEPKYCKWQRLFPYQEMLNLVREARIVITHGGPSSFIMPLQVGKIPIVVPRKAEFNEHVNNHQVAFAKAVAGRLGNILFVEDLNKLREIIINYNTAICDMNSETQSNNMKFNVELEKIVKNVLNKDIS